MEELINYINEVKFGKNNKQEIQSKVSAKTMRDLETGYRPVICFGCKIFPASYYEWSNIYIYTKKNIINAILHLLVKMNNEKEKIITSASYNHSGKNHEFILRHNTKLLGCLFWDNDKECIYTLPEDFSSKITDEEDIINQIKSRL